VELVIAFDQNLCFLIDLAPKRLSNMHAFLDSTKPPKRAVRFTWEDANLPPSCAFLYNVNLWSAENPTPKSFTVLEPSFTFEAEECRIYFLSITAVNENGHKTVYGTESVQVGGRYSLELHLQYP